MRRGILFFVIVAYGSNLGNGASVKPGQTKVDDSKIYFPEDTDIHSRSGEDDIPPECRNKNYCTIKPAKYPQEKYNQFFNNTKYLDSPQLIIEPVVTIDDKIGDESNDGCEIDVTYEPLFRVRSKRGDWHTVIQAPEKNYVQKIRLESCRSENAPCFQGIGYGSEITTGCVQKNSVWEFTVDDGNGGMTKIKSELPICCSCHYQVNFVNRMGRRK